MVTPWGNLPQPPPHGHKATLRVTGCNHATDWFRVSKPPCMLMCGVTLMLIGSESVNCGTLPTMLICNVTLLLIGWVTKLWNLSLYANMWCSPAADWFRVTKLWDLSHYANVWYNPAADWFRVSKLWNLSHYANKLFISGRRNGFWWMWS